MPEIAIALILLLTLCLVVIAYLNGIKNRLKDELNAAKTTISSQNAAIEAAHDRALIEEGNARLSARELDHTLAMSGWLREDESRACADSHSGTSNSSYDDGGSCGSQD